MTLQRILTGRHASVTFANILAIAEALALHLHSEVAPYELEREQAKRKAKQLVALVQEPSGLEGQAVDQPTIESMVERTTLELLVGSWVPQAFLHP